MQCVLYSEWVGVHECVPKRQPALILEGESLLPSRLLLECGGAIFLAHVSDSSPIHCKSSPSPWGGGVFPALPPSLFVVLCSPRLSLPPTVPPLLKCWPENTPCWTRGASPHLRNEYWSQLSWTAELYCSFQNLLSLCDHRTFEMWLGQQREWAFHLMAI